MSTATADMQTRLPQSTTSVSGIGLAGRTALTGAVAGGIVVGGFAIAGLAVAGRMRSSDLLGIGTILYVVGAALGFLHGAILGWLGREPDVSGVEARRQIGLAALYLPLPLACGWAASGWIATTAGNVLFGDLLLLVGTGFASAAGVFALGLAGRYSLESLRNAYSRWPERIAGTTIVLIAFAVLLATFLGLPPVVFGGVAPTGLGAFVAAGALTLWLVTPATLVGLRRRHQRR